MINLKERGPFPFLSHNTQASDGEVEDRLGRKRLKAKRKVSR